VRPTPAGEFVIERARRLLFDARCLQRDVDLYRNSQLGDIAFGVGPFPAATLMPRALSALRRLHPGIGMRVEVSNWRQLLDHLRAEDIEFFVADVRDVPQDAALDIRSLGRQTGRLFVRPKHPLVGRQCQLAEVWSCGIAATKLPTAIKTVLASLLGMPKGQEPSLVLECDDVAILRAVALSTDTVLAATDASVQHKVASGKLVPLRIKGLPSLFSEMGVVSLRNRTPSPMAQRAITCIGQVAAEVNAKH
jgi:DNA-binding transcriptional LysR family regulator